MTTANEAPKLLREWHWGEAFSHPNSIVPEGWKRGLTPEEMMAEHNELVRHARALQSDPRAIPPKVVDAINRAEWLIDQMPPNGKHWEKRLQFGAALTAARAALQSAPLPLQAVPPREWQPISNAPRDGTRLLAVDQTGYVMIVAWEGSGFLDETMDYPDWDLTHWQPLPLAPLTQEEK